MFPGISVASLRRSGINGNHISKLKGQSKVHLASLRRSGINGNGRWDQRIGLIDDSRFSSEKWN